jgi:hypothetical protein
MINTNRYIEEATEENIKQWLGMQTITETGSVPSFMTGYDALIECLKQQTLFAQFICSADDEKAGTFLRKLLNVFLVCGVSVDEVMSVVRENATCTTIQTSDWKECQSIPLLCDTGEKCCLLHSEAEFKQINKWGDERFPEKRRRIIHGETLLLETPENLPQYFIKADNRVYGISLIDREIIINHFSPIKPDMKIDLNEKFYKRFFWRGMLWNRDWKGPLHIITSLKFEDNLLRIDIENRTYPHSGFVLLDLKTAQVIESSPLTHIQV